MNELKDSMRMLADRASSSVDSLIEPAIVRGRRRRRANRLVRPVAALAAAVAVVVVIVLVTATLRSQQAQTISGDQRPLLVQIAAEPPQPLPADGKVGPVDLAYRTSCGDQDQPEAGNPCAMWRIRNGDGSQWRLTDVSSTENGDYRRVSLSPDGTRLAYMRNAGAIVVRDLVDGTVHQVDREPRPDSTDPERAPRSVAGWSPDGRWLAIDGDPHVRMVDTATWQTIDLPLNGAVIGLPDGGWPVPVYDFDNRWNTVALVARNTHVEREVRLPARKGFGDATFWDLDGQGLVTPDGTRIGAFALVPDGDAAVARLDAIDLRTGKVTAQHASGAIADIWMPTLLGWLDADILIAANNNNHGGIDYVKGFNLRTGQSKQLITFVDERPVPGHLSIAVNRL